ncbi:MAG: phosphoesterase PA-phosphatase [Verrucomicrobia bacterium]|nr:MAG: phosphoesterase PA-phosphatase [Verrucomicrobiota bacterium]
MKTNFALLPHEIAFGLFLAVTWLRLAFATGVLGRDSGLFLGLLAVNAVLTVRCVRQETNLNWRLRLLFYPVAMNITYANLKVSVPAIHPQLEDSVLQRIDHVLIGTNLSVRLEALVHPALTELFSICYILFFPYLVFSMIYYFCGDLRLLKKFFLGLFTIYGIGFLGYSFIPAVGPHLDPSVAAQFTVPLKGWWLTHWNSEMVRLGSNRVDAFPSLHCAVSSFLLFFDRVHKPWRFKLYLVPCVGLWLSTIYLRYHYVIDLICGFALSALCLWMADRFDRSQQTERKESHEIPARV